MLRKCSNVQVLNFPGVTNSHSGELERVLLSLERVEELRFGEGVDGDDPWIINLDPAIRDQFGTARWGFEQMKRISESPNWSKLRVLRLTSRIRSPPLGSQTAFEGVGLEEFDWGVKRGTPVNSDYLMRILKGCKEKKTLKKLKVMEHQIMLGGLSTILEEVGENLQELHVGTKDRFSFTGILENGIVGNCPNLLRLTLETPLDLNQDAFSLLSLLPTLEEVELRTIRACSLESGELERGIKSLPRIQTVALPLNAVAISLTNEVGNKLALVGIKLVLLEKEEEEV